ncbi:MAG: PspC domain-containing protein [Candidatus Paceibacterota bacterium]|jgi:phage shock protein C
MANNIKKLYRSATDKIIFGVCGGLGEYLEIDSLIVRIIFIVFAFAGGASIFIYLVLAVLIPKEGSETSKASKKNTIEVPQKISQEASNEESIMNLKDIFGLIIVVFGIMMLLKELFRFDIFAWINWGVIFSLFLIFVGFRLLSKKISK